MRGVLHTGLFVAVLAVPAWGDRKDSAVALCTPRIGETAPPAPVGPSFRREGDVATVAAVDFSRAGVSLVLPEVTYEPANLVEKKHPHRPTPELVEALKKSPRFRHAKDLSVHPKSLGGMAYVFEARYVENGEAKTAIVKVFHPDRPYFKEDAEAGRGPEAIALMIQRQLGLYQYLQDAVAAGQARKPGFNLTVAKMDLDPALVRHGVFVQDLAEGQSGHTLQTMSGAGFEDLKQTLYRDQKLFTDAVRGYFGNRTPAYLDGTPRFLDEGNDWSNFHWVGKYLPPDYEQLDVKRITLIDW